MQRHSRLTKLLSTLMVWGLLCFSNLFYGQIFSWNNPYITSQKDSIPIDSLLKWKLTQEVFKRDTLDFVTLKNKILIDEEVLAKNDRKKLLGDLNTKGSIVRGMSFGNNQGSSAQSSMDLQISGKLSKDVSILASISDHNLPIQADGYTQSLEEFDKIYMQLNIKKSTILRAGHIDLADQNSHFSRYQRRSMGLQLQTELGEKHKTLLDISAGVARSEFHRVRFQGIEGNQGPYRLTGKNAENFITILSGSEQIFIDGIPMKRGENADYIINYHTGEITFTSFRPIFRQNFITVSYNYTNRNYNRYLFTSHLSHSRERFSNSLQWFYETDNKFSPLSISLSKEDEQVLTQAGNNPELMYAESGQETPHDVNKVLYRRVPHGSSYYYEHSNEASETLYQVSFTHFGTGKGDYIIEQTNTNGRVFRYVGMSAGDYRAVRKLPAPKSTNLIAYNALYKWDKDNLIGTNLAYTNYDSNLFSQKDSHQNNGYAFHIFGNRLFEKKNWIGNAKIAYQHIDARFYILDRLQSVEFARDFNLKNEFNNRTQNQLTASFHNSWNKSNQFNYQFSFLQEARYYQGIKNTIDFQWRKKNYETKGAFSALTTSSTDENTSFIRGNMTHQLAHKWGTSSIGIALEHNLRKYQATREYDKTSFSWREAFVQHKIGDSIRTKLSARAYFRSNDSISYNRLERATQILGGELESHIIKTKNTTLSSQVHYRKFLPIQTSFDTTKNQDFVIGNILFHQQTTNGGVRFQSFYELGNGQEAQREFQYIRVTDGKGIYKWTDYNNDGIQQLDEFEVAEYADLAQYIRIYTHSVKYLPSNKNKLQLSLFISPATVFNWDNSFAKRFNINLSLHSQNSYLKNNRLWVLNPFERSPQQLLKNQTLLASIQFNANQNSGYNGVYRYTKNENILNANQSNEQRQTESHILNTGYWFSKDTRLDIENQYTHIDNRSQLLYNRNYLLRNYEIKPKFTYKFLSSFQTELSTSFKHRKRTDGEELLRAKSITATLQWDSKKTTVRSSLSWIDNSFTGNGFSLVANQMLDGLKPGSNKVWSVLIQQAINSFITLHINYEGRNSGERTIHIGSMQLRANF